MPTKVLTMKKKLTKQHKTMVYHDVKRIWLQESR